MSPLRVKRVNAGTFQPTLYNLAGRADCETPTSDQKVTRTYPLYPRLGGSPTAAAVFFADQLSRMRALNADETDLLSRILARELALRPLRRWTGPQDAQLRDLLADGRTAAEIGTIVGRTTDAIHTRVKRLKMKEKNDG